MARISWFSAGEASSGPKFKSTCEIAESRNVHPSIWLVSAMVTDMWHMIKRCPLNLTQPVPFLDWLLFSSLHLALLPVYSKFVCRTFCVLPKNRQPKVFENMPASNIIFFVTKFTSKPDFKRTCTIRWTLAVVRIIPNQPLSFKFSPTKIEELTAGSDEKTQRSPAGDRTRVLQMLVTRLWPLSYEVTAAFRRLWFDPRCRTVLCFFRLIQQSVLLSSSKSTPSPATYQFFYLCRRKGKKLIVERSLKLRQDPPPLRLF